MMAISPIVSSPLMGAERATVARIRNRRSRNAMVDFIERELGIRGKNTAGNTLSRIFED